MKPIFIAGPPALAAALADVEAVLGATLGLDAAAEDELCVLAGVLELPESAAFLLLEQPATASAATAAINGRCFLRAIVFHPFFGNGEPLQKAVPRLQVGSVL